MGITSSARGEHQEFGEVCLDAPYLFLHRITVGLVPRRDR